jgi:hypothetical protein
MSGTELIILLGIGWVGGVLVVLVLVHGGYYLLTYLKKYL